MPNHETNTVVIIGKPENVARFVEEATVSREELSHDELGWGMSLSDYPERMIDFEKIVPPPENIETGGCPGHGGMNGSGEYIEVDEKTGEQRVRTCWYWWNTEKWGTKWGAYGHSHFDHFTFKPFSSDEVLGRVDLKFETAWSQPTPIFEAIEERWDVEVHAVTQDEGGFPDVEFGNPWEHLSREVTVNFEVWGRIEEAADYKEGSVEDGR